MNRLVSDFEYPLATGLRVPAASIDGLCVGCLAAWPCTRCPDPFGGVPSSGGTGVVNPLMRPAPVPSSTPDGPRRPAVGGVAAVVLCVCVVTGCEPVEDTKKGDSQAGDLAVQFWCDRPVDRLVGSARLQRKEGRRWVVVPGAVGREPRRNPNAYAIRNGKTYELKKWTHSQPVTDPCANK